MKKIISFCLWGETPMYTIGAVRNAELALTIYPGWVCRYYCGASVPTDIIDQLQSFSNTEVIMMEEEGNWHGMFWRFYAASDDDVEIVLSRDTDSRLNQREKDAVDEWLESDKDFHIMRDHRLHGIEILGGTWGAKNKVITQMVDLCNNYQKHKKNCKGTDQWFLRSIVWPLVVDNSLAHDENKFGYAGLVKPFPTPRHDSEFVGMIYDELDNPDKRK